jgi:hypothetical protein
MRLFTQREGFLFTGSGVQAPKKIVSYEIEALAKMGVEFVTKQGCGAF